MALRRWAVWAVLTLGGVAWMPSAMAGGGQGRPGDGQPSGKKPAPGKSTTTSGSRPAGSSDRTAERVDANRVAGQRFVIMDGEAPAPSGTGSQYSKLPPPPQYDRPDPPPPAGSGTPPAGAAGAGGAKPLPVRPSRYDDRTLQDSALSQQLRQTLPNTTPTNAGSSSSTSSSTATGDAGVPPSGTNGQYARPAPPSSRSSQDALPASTLGGSVGGDGRYQVLPMRPIEASTDGGQPPSGSSANPNGQVQSLPPRNILAPDSRSGQYQRVPVRQPSAPSSQYDDASSALDTSRPGPGAGSGVPARAPTAATGGPYESVTSVIDARRQGGTYQQLPLAPANGTTSGQD